MCKLVKCGSLPTKLKKIPAYNSFFRFLANGILQTSKKPKTSFYGLKREHTTHKKTKKRAIPGPTKKN